MGREEWQHCHCQPCQHVERAVQHCGSAQNCSWLKRTPSVDRDSAVLNEILTSCTYLATIKNIKEGKHRAGVLCTHHVMQSLDTDGGRARPVPQTTTKAVTQTHYHACDARQSFDTDNQQSVPQEGGDAGYTCPNRGFLCATRRVQQSTSCVHHVQLSLFARAAISFTCSLVAFAHSVVWHGSINHTFACGARHEIRSRLDVVGGRLARPAHLEHVLLDARPAHAKYCHRSRRSSSLVRSSLSRD
ncbi:hypothetical protein LXA43DRAFT_513868 [Ganoderma leucocontextum]|nr:hypothetical protein LXA43DRAFT_513868 [Ganoderma leucocontextum]